MADSIQTTNIDSVLIQEITDRAVSQIIPSLETSILYDLGLALGIGVVSGLIATAIFFAFMRYFIPKIVFGNVISKELNEEHKGDTPKYKYYIKFYNDTGVNIDNVSIDLLLMEAYINGTGKNFKSTRLKIEQNGFKFLAGKDNKDVDLTNNCVQISILEDLESIWDGKTMWLHLQIDSFHSVSGRRKVHVTKFKDPTNTIKMGKFDSGETFKIIK